MRYETSVTEPSCMGASAARARRAARRSNGRWLAAEWHNQEAVWWCGFGSEVEALEAVGLRE
jgi:hypothetical protein